MQRDALFDLLNRSPAAVWVVTPNRRLARALTADFDAYQMGQCRTVWETPQILPFSAFIAKLYDAAQHDPALTGVRTPLTPAQARTVWEAVVVDSEIGLLSSTAAAALASNAWSLAHQWNIASRMRRYTFGADTRAFIGWASEYQRRVDAAGATDSARLTDIVREYLAAGAIAAPSTVVLAGFNDMNVQQQQFIDALIAHGSDCERLEPLQHPTAALRAECLDEQNENARMADWVAARLAANAHARIGIVVPDLASRRRALASALDAALLPDQLQAPVAARPYTMSLGGSLADIALVAFSLRAIRLVMIGVDLEEASAVLRSPYLAGAAIERDARDRLDAELRRRCERAINFERLFEAVERGVRDCSIDVPNLFNQLRGLRQWRRNEASRFKRPSEWAVAIANMLQSISAFVAGDRVLDSNEYQALARWHELLAEFAALDRVTGRLAPSAAITQLERIARETIFQPEGGAPPVQVLGVLEANGLTFDHLWMIGLTADAWPPASRPHPLLPIELQRAAGMPGASAAAELARARRQLQQLIAASPEVIVSHAKRDGDRELAPSPLIAAFEPWTPPPCAPRLVDAMTTTTLVSQTDAIAPAWRPLTALPGGAAVLQDQAACPFRAFARHRLNTKSIEAPHDGLDHRERGSLVHDVLAHFWSSLPEPTRDALAAMPFDQRRALLKTAADAALVRLRRRRSVPSAALIELESARLVRLIGQWLQYEVDTRAPFRVAAIEEARPIRVGPLTFTARLDRVDEQPDGTRIVLDYKTGGPKTGAWLDQRPDEPQLPLYLTASEPDARAIAFARVRAGDICLSGLAAEPALLPERSNQWEKMFADWDALVRRWFVVLERLATEFADGDAAVNPKRRPQTCRYCDLPTLCRINERGGSVDAGDGDVVDDDNAR